MAKQSGVGIVSPVEGWTWAGGGGGGVACDGACCDKAETGSLPLFPVAALAML